MKIAHKLSKNLFEKEFYQNETAFNVGFLTANRKGDFASFFNQNSSRYQGLFFRNFGKIYKIIENISLVEEGKIVELKNEFWRHIRTSKTSKGIAKESFFLPEKNRGLVYELSNSQKFNLFLDFKPIYGNSEAERNYKIEKDKQGIIVIECFNQKDRVFLAIKLNSSSFSIKNEWVRRNYELDKKRNSIPFERNVFWALEIVASKMAVGIGDTKKQALNEANYIFDKTYALKKEKRRNIKSFVDLLEIKSPETSMAYLSSQNALRELVFEEHGQKQICAGLPWFFDFWTRDAFVSIKALLNKDEDAFWKICHYGFNLIGENGFLTNKTNTSNQQNADAVGWLFKRAGEAIENKKINEMTVWKVKKYLKKALEDLLKYSNKTELATAIGNGTWMDSIDRTGERIELQALRLYMLKLAYTLTNDSSYRILEASLKFKVKERFWSGEILFDSPTDQTIRPNIFLVAYVYPELLEEKEWQICFDNVLDALWLPWGGIATIDKRSPYFHEHHTGELSQSYHSGDSWFYLNNLTAIVLKRNNPERYKAYIEKIIEASSREILLMGAIGCHAELSSASHLSSEGCWSQAWSAALFVELVQEICKK
ncbi:MAG: amylo-alpha-1,6-glucosidase [Candidatus Pacebacteria bacterium]|nr:amylo-alpha-1,6-glucosidase [Candidatus Paceibacterota bacterium]